MTARISSAIPAFADLKVHNTCEGRVLEAALAALARQESEAKRADNWSHREERLKTIATLRAKLQELQRG